MHAGITTTLSVSAMESIQFVNKHARLEDVASVTTAYLLLVTTLLRYARPTSLLTFVTSTLRVQASSNSLPPCGHRQGCRKLALICRIFLIVWQFVPRQLAVSPTIHGRRAQRPILALCARTSMHAMSSISARKIKPRWTITMDYGIISERSSVNRRVGIMGTKGHEFFASLSICFFGRLAAEFGRGVLFASGPTWPQKKYERSERHTASLNKHKPPQQ